MGNVGSTPTISPKFYLMKYFSKEKFFYGGKYLCIAFSSIPCTRCGISRNCYLNNKQRSKWLDCTITSQYFEEI